jgi:hypothetical protein
VLAPVIGLAMSIAALRQEESGRAAVICALIMSASPIVFLGALAFFGVNVFSLFR